MNSIDCRSAGNLRLLARLFWGSVASIGLLQVSHAAGAETAAAPVTAVWKAHEVKLHYYGFTTYYTCSGIEDRLETILKQLGANDDVRVSASGCMGVNDVSNMISARIRVRMPVASPSNGAESFSAVSSPVTLRTLRAGEVGAGECELLEEVRDRLLPALNIAVVSDDLLCVPRQASHVSRSLKVSALIAAAQTPR